MRKKNILLSLFFCLASSNLLNADEFIVAKPQENIKSVIAKIGIQKDIVYDIQFEDFKLKNSRDLKIKSIDELIEYVKNTNGYEIIATNKNKSKYQNKLPIYLTSLNVPKKVVVKPEAKKEDKTTSIINFNQLYIYINEHKEKNSSLSSSSSIHNSKEIKTTDVKFLKEKIYEIAKNNSKIDLLFLNQRLRDIDTLEKAEQLIKELERI